MNREQVSMPHNLQHMYSVSNSVHTNYPYLPPPSPPNQLFRQYTLTKLYSGFSNKLLWLGITYHYNSSQTAACPWQQRWKWWYTTQRLSFPGHQLFCPWWKWASLTSARTLQVWTLATGKGNNHMLQHHYHKIGQNMLRINGLLKITVWTQQEFKLKISPFETTFYSDTLI
jgi:hypothetical protein